MSDQLAFLPERVFTAAAMPGTGYQVRFYQSGTTTPVEVYTSAALDTPHVQPIVCDASGVFPQVFSAGGAIKAVVTKPDESVFYTLDPVFRVPTSSSGAVDITFSPTGPLPYTNVQAAIEGSVAAAATGFNAFGLGITGNAVLLANIDATNIGAGTYRFDGTTTGTYPTGVVAADAGLIETWRQSASVGMMELHHATTNRRFRRRLTAGAWGAWRENIEVNIGATRGDIIRRGASDWDRLAIGGANSALISDGTDAAWTTGAPFFGTRAWASFAGATGAISSSGNVTSVTRGGVGVYTINFTANAPHANFNVSVMTDGGTIFTAIGGRAVGTCTVNTRNNTGTLVDPGNVTVSCVW